MPKKSENADTLIKEINKKHKEVLDEIEKRPSENWIKIKRWINQENVESLSCEDVQLRAIIINTIYCFFKKELILEKKSLLKRYLHTILNNFNNLPNEEIIILISHLKKCIYTGDKNDKSELEDLIIKIKQLGLLNKIKPQVIEFDAEGKGFVVDRPGKLARKTYNYETVSQTNTVIEINKMHYKVFSRYENEAQLTKDIREAALLRSILSREKIGIKYERSLEILFQSIELEEFKEVIRRKICDFKNQNTNIILSTYKQPKIFQLPKFLDIQNKYLPNFLLIINFSNLERLIKEVQIISDNIYILMPILADIKNFYCEWKISCDLFKSFQIEVDNFKKTFNQESIINYLEIMMSLIEEKKLKLDGTNFGISYQSVDLCIKNLVVNSLIEKFNIIKLKYSMENFLNDQKKEIKNYIARHFQMHCDVYSKKRTKFSLFKLFLIKMKKVILNFFCVSFFITNKKNLEFLTSKCDFYNLNFFLFESIYDEVNLKIKWWKCFVYRINPFFLISSSFKKSLSEQLFLYIVNCKFTKIIESSTANKMSTDREKIIKCADALFLIQSILDQAKITNIKCSADFYGYENKISSPKSKKQVIDFLEKAEILTELSKVISTLSQNIKFSMQEFSKLFHITLENMKKLEENPEKDNFFLNHITNGRCIFQLSKNTRSEGIVPNVTALKA